MSRIEEAIERAMKLRGERQRTAPEHTGAPADETGGHAQKAAQEGRPAVEVRCDSPYIVALNDQRSQIAEEYRKLRSTVLALTNRGEKFLNTLMITSTVGAEGKSITALNLAITLSRDYDYTALLIDADLRKPSLHKYMNIEPGIGITDCIAGEAELADAIVRTDIGKLSFLPAGRQVENPVELLSSQKMKDLIAQTKNRYADRYIIIDTPPILPFAETRSLSAMVDGVIFVVKERTAASGDISEALGVLKGCNILGIVYNGASEELRGNYGYYSY